jgi:hypothetical protein
MIDFYKFILKTKTNRSFESNESWNQEKTFFRVIKKN